MLFTRCPECDTTFRVNDETLKKASGQVRCGRCASVFNAYAELHDPSAKSLEAEPAPAPRPAEPPAATAPAKPPPAISPPPAAPSAAPVQARPAEATAAAARHDTAAVAEAVAEANVAAADAEESASADPAASSGTHAISATEVDRVLTVDPPLSPSEYVWPRLGELPPKPPKSRWWAVAAALALLALGVQAIHHFRSAIAGHPTFGPLLTTTYEALGSEITPSWDVHQYQILDWVATAEPNARGLGSLKITARIQNRGPSRQPFPAVQLRLKDRYEAALGSRMFTPAEYLPRDMPRGRLMSPGETTRAEIEVVDPGPNAYGFELDVCIEVEASLVTCGTDEVFL
jgi:predicted Zn finger-like uncharacterized protein